MSSPLLIVGPSPETIQAARDSILEILKVTNDQATKVVALQTLAVICDVKNVTISNNCFYANPEAQTP